MAQKGKIFGVSAAGTGPTLILAGAGMKYFGILPEVGGVAIVLGVIILAVLGILGIAGVSKRVFR